MAETFDPFDATQVQSAWPLLAELRRRGPVAPLADGMIYVTRHAAAREVLRDTDHFSNASGFKAPGVVVPVEDRTLGELDPPAHGPVRRVMVGVLTPGEAQRVVPFIESTARALLRARPSDLVEGFTVPLPNRVTVHLLGLPSSDAEQISAWARELMESGFPATNRSERGEGFEAAFPDFAGYIDGRLAERRTGGHGRRDVVAALAQSDLSARQQRAMVRNLITGGLTTTAQLLGNLVDLALGDTDAEQAMRDGALGAAVEESLRLRPPVMFVPRGCVGDVTIGSEDVGAGTRVIVGVASANRDDAVFEDPDSYRWDRPGPADHLTFGFGRHACPGAALARAVALTGMRALFDEFPAGTIALAPGYRYDNVPTFFECGPARLPVEYHGAG